MRGGQNRTRGPFFVASFGLVWTAGLGLQRSLLGFHVFARFFSEKDGRRACVFHMC